MKIFGRSKPPATPSTEAATPRLVFASTSALEQALDGTDDAFISYFFAVYQCSPLEEAGINRMRDSLRSKHPELAQAVGRFYILFGEAAFQALAFYYGALQEAATLPDDFRQYAGRRLAEIERIHGTSQRLPTPIDLSEGQLAADADLEFFALVALYNRQILRATAP